MQAAFSLPLLLGALALTLVGCGDDGPGSVDDASTGSPSSTGSTSDPGESTGLPPDEGSSGPGVGSTTGEPDPDTGSTGEPPDDSSSGEPPLGDPVTLAVGYGGMRARSLDDGQTWQDYVQLGPAGGDDMDLLRGAAWGEGRFVAVGWRVFSSPDGVRWTEHQNPTSQWYGAVAHGNDQFLAVGGGGYCARSDDGELWEACTDATDDDGFTHVRSVLFSGGLFYTADANGVLRSSPDGAVWTVEDAGFGTPWAAVEGGMIVPAEQSAPAEFATKRLRGGSPIERAEPGTEAWIPVYDVPDGNRVFQAYRFAYAEGWVQ